MSSTNEWVAEQLTSARATATGGLEDISSVSGHPDRPVAACVLAFRPAPTDDQRKHFAMVDLETGDFDLIALAGVPAGRPVWSPDGERLALVVHDHGTQAVIVQDGRPAVISAADGAVESCCWSPDGRRLAMIVAEAGAELSDVVGSGVVSDPDDVRSWRPRVSPAVAGRRKAVVWDLESGELSALGQHNVWELSWHGDEALIALVSEAAGEGAWYGARLAVIGLDGQSSDLHAPVRQLAQPKGAPGGAAWSVLSGVASDRGLLAGDVLVGRSDSAAAAIDTAGVHVTDHVWLDADRILMIGMRGLETAIVEHDLGDGTSTVRWESSESSGLHQPELGGAAEGSPVMVLESHSRPPTLGRIANREFVPSLTADGPGADFVRQRTGCTEQIVWTSRDGTEIQGLLTVPDTTGPHALVVNVHGGPIAAWHDSWLGRDVYTTLLVSRGYAVLRPNPRGSTGRGAAFAEAVVGDIGGRDVDDILTGVEHLVGSGRVDGARVGLTGNSYGGYMAAWIPCISDALAAAVARSPVTEWISQHFTSNLAEFDAMMLAGDLFDPSSHYVTRSPFARQAGISTPILFTAGALDLATPASQAQMLYGPLAERGVETALVIYPEEGHGVRATAALHDQCTRMIDWFERFMPPSA